MKRCQTCSGIHTHTHTHTDVYDTREEIRAIRGISVSRENKRGNNLPTPPLPPWSRVESQAAKFSFVSESISRENTLK